MQLYEKSILNVGIFFLVDKSLLCDLVPIAQGQPYGDHIEHGGHYDFWSNLVPANAVESAFKAHAYDYYPRGRVVFDAKQKRLKLYIDRCIGAASRVTIRETFNLPPDTLMAYDTHYQCRACNPTFLDDFEDSEEFDDDL